MATSKNDYMGLFHYVDNEGFGGDIEVHADDPDTLFARIDEVREKAKNRNFTGRPADKEKSYNKYTPVQKTAEDAATEVFGNNNPNTKSCPVCDTSMRWTPNNDGRLVKNGPLKGQVLPDSWTCPKCDKKVWVKKPKNEAPV